MSKQTDKKEGGFGYYLRIAGVLTLICSFVALMLAVVNIVTRDVIAENDAVSKKSAIAEIFTDMEDARLYDEYVGDEEIYLVYKGGEPYGYCASIITPGYGGDISMMVGVNADGEIVGVKIISMSETAGLGSKTGNEAFLGQFAGKSGTLVVKENVDAVSGATISSKAVTAGVNKALQLGIDLEYASGKVEDAEEADAASDTENKTQASSPDTEGIDVLYNKEPDSTNISSDMIGGYQSGNGAGGNYTNTYSRDTDYYLQHETTDTESETTETTAADTKKK